MKLFSEQLLSEIDKQLQSIHSKTDNPVHYSELAIKTLIPTFENLKTKFLKHTFTNKSEEIVFFVIPNHNLRPNSFTTTKSTTSKPTNHSVQKKQSENTSISNASNCKHFIMRIKSSTNTTKQTIKV